MSEDEHEMFLGMFKVKKVILVNDHRFILGDTNEKVDVRPVTLDKLIEDRDKLAKQEVYIFPQPNDIAKRTFLVYYDRNIDINTKA